jgi:hypothetical protein
VQGLWFKVWVQWFDVRGLRFNVDSQSLGFRVWPPPGPSTRLNVSLQSFAAVLAPAGVLWFAASELALASLLHSDMQAMSTVMSVPRLRKRIGFRFQGEGFSVEGIGYRVCVLVFRV